MNAQDIDMQIAHPKDIDSWIKWIEARGYDKELKCACGEDVPWLLSQLKSHREALKASIESLKRIETDYTVESYDAPVPNSYDGIGETWERVSRKSPTWAANQATEALTNIDRLIGGEVKNETDGA